MRRTYRSKKETGGGLDPRDVILTLDSQSSVFDAFYIQNIKQTKRELSVGPSVQFAGTNKVRKRKYVKRLKEQEPIIRESTSRSAYLTPDKSFRVNKAPDLFDQLLNSSIKNESMDAIKNDLSIKKVKRTSLQKKGQTYCRHKSLKKKKVNYSSSDYTDSDKENSNSSKEKNITNSSDILSHKLLIEKECETQKYDESIAKIVKNLSLFKETNDKFSITPRKEPKLQYQGLINGNSPLCSTPFLEKYRGKSIYKFSPISINLNDSHKFTMSEENIKENNSGRDFKENVVSERTKQHQISINANKEPCNEVLEVQSPILPNRSTNKTKIRIPTFDVSYQKTENNFSLQTTEVEPFLGFSINKQNSINLEAISNKFNEIQQDILTINSSIEEVVNKSISLHGTVVEGNSGAEEISNTKSSIESGTESLYNTCNSDDFDEEDITDKEPVVIMEKLSDSIFLKYYENMADFSNQSSNETNSSSSEDPNSDEYASFEGTESITSSSDISEYKNDSQQYSNNDLDVTDSNNETEYEQEKDTCISFVTTRRGKDKTNDSFILGFDNYITSANNSEFEKTKNIIDNSKENKDFTLIDDKEDFQDISSPDKLLHNSITSASSSEFNKTVLANNIIENYQENKDLTLINDKEDLPDITSHDKLLNNSINSAISEFDKTVFTNNIIENTQENKDLTLVNNKEDLQDISSPDQLLHNVNNTDHMQEIMPSAIARNSFITTRKSSITRASLKRKTKSPRTSRISVETNLNNCNLAKYRITTRQSSKLNRDSVDNRFSLKQELQSHKDQCPTNSDKINMCDLRHGIVLQPGKRWERSLSIYRRMTTMTDHFDRSLLDDEPLSTKGRKYRQSVISTMEMQDLKGSVHNESINSRRSTFVSKPRRSTIRIVTDSNISRVSLCSTSVLEETQGFLTEDCDDTIVELSKLSIADPDHEITIIEKFHDTSNRFATARDYVLRRCNQTDVILFDECYPDTVLKNCRKIGEGVYGEVFLWRAGDGRARVLKVIPIAGNVKVNGEDQKDYHEIISEIVIAMELSTLRAPITDIENHFNEGKSVETLDLHSVENATDVFNEVLAVRCVYGNYPSRLLDLWDLYDECKGSENDNPAILPDDQQFIVLELANAGQDLESYQFHNAEQAFALFKQVAFGLAVAEESHQFEHRDLHWGNVLISPTDQKYATFVLRGRSYAIERRGVRASVIDYSVSRAALRLPAGERAALYSDLADDEALFDAVGDRQFEVYRLMREKLGNDWKNFEPYTNILWLHYTVDKMITALRYTRTNTKIHKHYIAKLKDIRNRILDYGSAVQYILTDNEF